MKHFVTYVACLISLVPLFGLSLSAQAPAAGIPPFSSIGGGPFDALNLGNLNVHFSVPILHKAGRGIPFSYDLIYESSIYQIVTSGSTKSWQPVNTVNNVASYWGWQGLGPVISPYVSYSVVYTTNTCYQNGTVPYSEWQYSNFTYYDNQGTAHYFNVNQVYFSSPGGSNCPPDGPQPTTPQAPITASDGSGITLYLDLAQSGGTESGHLSYKNGTIINPAPFLSSPPTSSSPFTATDANGNKITLNNGVYTDTLGTTVLTVSGSAPNPTKFTYTAPAGSQFYTVNYGSYNIKTNFGCSGVGEYNASNVYLVSSIVLPDTSQYSFSYEGTPNNPSFTTGRISQVTLPTNGTISYNYTYTGSNDGINCSDASTMVLQRTLSPGGQWQYSRSGSGSAWTTNVTDPSSNQTVIKFAEDGATNPATFNFYETQRQVSQLINGTQTLLATFTKCYNLDPAHL